MRRRHVGMGGGGLEETSCTSVPAPQYYYSLPRGLLRFLFFIAPSAPLSLHQGVKSSSLVLFVRV
eukprot:2711297-Pyramimonas_sp.AAC.1